MSIKEYIADKRKIQNAILSFIDEEEESKTKYHEISTLLTDPTLITNKEELKQVILIISNISDNHHRTTNFFDKITRLIEPIKEDLKKNFTNQELFTFFKNNKRTLLQLVNENIITIDDNLFQKKNSSYHYEDLEMELLSAYFSPELGIECIEFPESIEKFKEYREKGENPSKICELIRQDAIEEFIIYVNRNNIPLSSEINESIFETNSFLINKCTHLIEYATFFGAIQIFQYIQINCPDLLTNDLWIYGIHSNNAQMINILEGNKILPKDRTYEECMIESIKCHHNEIYSYIKEILFDKSKSNENEEENYNFYDIKDEFRLIKSPLLYHNFEFIPDDFESILKLIFYLIENEYSSLVKLVNDQSQFLFDINNYEPVKRILNSSFLTFIVRNKMTSKEFLIKTLQKEKYADEFSRVMICRYPSILGIKGFSSYDITNAKNPTILTDYYQTTLLDYINNKRMRECTYTKTNDYIIILGITIGLRYLQKNGIFHEDLRPDSILLNENLYPIIQDVEMSKRLSLDIYKCENIRGAPLYMPPQQFDGYRFLESNVFQFSFILYYLIILKKPEINFSDNYLFMLKERISRGIRPDLSQIGNEIISKFLLKCWIQDLKQELTFDEILDFITKEEFYSYFEPLDNDSVKKYLDEYGNEFDEIKKRFK